MWKPSYERARRLQTYLSVSQQTVHCTEIKLSLNIVAYCCVVESNTTTKFIILKVIRNRERLIIKEVGYLAIRVIFLMYSCTYLEQYIYIRNSQKQI